MPEPIATWNPARGVWETSQYLICGHSAVYSETWPTSGTTRRGMAYEQPTSVPPTDGSGCSSLLPSPNGRDWRGSRHVDHALAHPGPLLPEAIDQLLPTPNPFHMGNNETPTEWLARRKDVQERTGTRHGPALSVVAQSVTEGHPLYQGGQGPTLWNDEEEE